MARAPNEKVNKALSLYRKGYKLIDIAKELDIPVGTIRSWKNRYSWDNDNNATLQKNKRNVANKKSNNNNAKKKVIEDEVKEVMENTELTDKQRLFCIYYIKYFNATKAAIKAGYSKESAGKIGYQLLEKTRIKNEIDELKKNKLNRAMLSEDDIFQKYMDIAFSDITDYLIFGQEEVPVMGAFGPVIDKETKEPITKIINVVKFKESTEIDGTLISEVKQGKDGASIKLQDKMKALQWLSDRLDLKPTIDREKLELEKKKVQQVQERLDYEKNKNNQSDEPIKIIIKRKERED